MPDISIIIPCKNEEQYISLCLDALLKQTQHFPKSEIILVDNGSTDSTLDIARRYGTLIKLLRLPHHTISEVRNHGAMNSIGEWLTFVDADVEVDDNWGANFIRSIDEFEKKGINLSNIITGSTYSIPQKSCWIERVWFHSLTSRDKSSDRYINGGNLIIHRQLFNKTGGFDPAYDNSC